MTAWRLPSRMHTVRCAVALLFLFADSAAAQSTTETNTRTAAIERQQQEKAQVAAPYVPDRVERLFQDMEENGFPLVGTPTGFYPAMGNIFGGGGLGFGAGYRRFVGDNAIIDTRALISISTYKRAEIAWHSPGHDNGRVTLDARVGWLDAPRIKFYGLGADSSPDDRTVFRLRQSYIEARVTWKPARWIDFGIGASYDAYDQAPGTGPLPPIDDRFTEATAPHLGEDPTYLKLSTSARLLWLQSPEYSRHGGFLRWSYDSFHHQDSTIVFGLTRAEIVQHIPILRETWVVSLRARTDGVVGSPDDAPFFLLPSLGSGSTLRGFQTGRFRDLNSVLFSGEWRWIPNRLAIDLALFADAGRVADDWDELFAGSLRKDYGIGVRFHAPSVTALRIDLARGDEGTRLVVASSGAF